MNKDQVKINQALTFVANNIGEEAVLALAEDLGIKDFKSCPICEEEHGETPHYFGYCVVCGGYHLDEKLLEELKKLYVYREPLMTDFLRHKDNNEILLFASPFGPEIRPDGGKGSLNIDDMIQVKDLTYSEQMKIYFQEEPYN